MSETAQMFNGCFSVFVLAFYFKSSLFYFNCAAPLTKQKVPFIQTGIPIMPII